MESNKQDINLSIGFITPEYAHPKVKHAAGIGTSINNLALALSKRNLNVFVFVYNQDVEEIIISEGIEIHLIKSKKYKYFGWFLYRKHIQRYVDTIVKNRDIDILEAPDWTGITAFIKFTVPLIIRLHGSDAYFCKLGERKQKLKNFMFEKIALKNATKIVSVSRFTAKTTAQIFKLKDDIKVIHNGINVDQFTPNNNQVIKGQLLYFGAIIRKKGILELAKTYNLIVKENKNVSLVLLGKDSIDIIEKTSTLQLFYKILTPEAKATVTYLNEVPYQNVKEYISMANIVVLPSFAEAFPMTWLEALAMQKALVTSNIGWANEIMVNNKIGYTVNPKSHKEFSEKIIELLSNQKKCELFGMNARQWVIGKFSTRIITDQNIEYYKSIIEK